MKVLVIGAGAAGVAAAFEASRRGAEVRLLHAHAGSSELNTGAVDLMPWTEQVSSQLDRAMTRFVEALGLWSVPAEMLLATSSGVLRPAAGADRALLNLAPLAGKVVAVPIVERDDWDAALLVRSLRESAWTRTAGTRFEAVEVPLLWHSYERRIPAHDFAALHDQPERRRWLCDKLGNASAPDAWLLGPWLGVEPTTVTDVRRELGTEVGETTSLPGGPAGARFVRARDELLATANVDVRQARVRRVAHRGTRWEVVLDSNETLHADAVVIATGGVAGGGILLEPIATQLTQSSFRLSLDAPVELFIKNRRAENVASAHGFDFASAGMGVLERVGAQLLPDCEDLFLAGDVVAGRPNTVLMAVGTGIAVVEELFRGSGVLRAMRYSEPPG